MCSLKMLLLGMRRMWRFWKMWILTWSRAKLLRLLVQLELENLLLWIWWVVFMMWMTVAFWLTELISEVCSLILCVLKWVLWRRIIIFLAERFVRILCMVSLMLLRRKWLRPVRRCMLMILSEIWRMVMIQNLLREAVNFLTVRGNS